MNTGLIAYSAVIVKYHQRPLFLFSVTPKFFFFFFFVFLLFFLANPVAYGGSQARGRIGAVAAGLRHSHCNTAMQDRIGAESATYTTAHGNAGSLTH